MMNEGRLKEVILLRRGSCPSGRELIELEESLLDSASEKNLREHLTVCPFCSDLMNRLESATDLQTAFKFEEADRTDAAYTRPGVSAVSTWRDWPKLAIAASFLLGVGLTAAVGSFYSRLELAATASPRPTILRLENRVRLATPTVAQLTLHDSSPLVALSFFIAVSESVAVNCSIEDLAGNAVSGPERITTFDGIGNFLLFVPAAALTQGESYLLRVRWSDPAHGERETTHTFHVASGG